MNKVLGMTAAVLGEACLVVLTAKAATYDVNFIGTSGFDVSAVMTTSNVLNAVNGYDILTITGTVSGPTSGLINGLIANPNQPLQGTYTDPITSLAWK